MAITISEAIDSRPDACEGTDIGERVYSGSDKFL